MPGPALEQLLTRVEAAICEYSEELVTQLAHRDELEFEKEVKNTFITQLMEVQNRQKEQRDGGKRRRRDKGLSLQGNITVSPAPTTLGTTMPIKVSAVGVCTGLNALLVNAFTVCVCGKHVYTAREMQRCVMECVPVHTQTAFMNKLMDTRS